MNLRSGDDGMTPLMNAAERCRENVMRELLRRGADARLESCDPHEKEIKRTALNYLLQSQDSRHATKEMAELLLDHGADVDHQGGYDRETPLISAIKIRKKEIAKLLIERGAKLDLQDHSGRIALDLMRIFKNNDLLETLEKTSAPVKIPAKDGENSLKTPSKPGKESFSRKDLGS